MTEAAVTIVLGFCNGATGTAEMTIIVVTSIPTLLDTTSTTYRAAAKTNALFYFRVVDEVPRVL